ncbi:MAG: peptidylprolyl isomerase [Candidatus Alcyoniella australis]|nr:peptidylprolyl isomerase [Candidatus Alcyoniella australis]
MTKAKDGDTVKVHYTGTFDDGSEFDTSKGSDPMEFCIGAGEIIDGFEQALIGMSIGDKKTENIPADNAYGQRKDEMVFVVEKEQFPPEIAPQVGQRLQVPMQNGQMLPVTITEISETEVTLDANHPLAGRDLTFKIELVEIV